MPSGELTEIEFAVANMACDGCAASIRRALGSIQGVADVRPEVSSKRVIVRFEARQVTEARLQQELARIGYPAA